MDKHEITWMSTRRIKCSCGWTYGISRDEEFGICAGQDHLLDTHSAHRQVGGN